jgi:hypothetical protein
MLLIFACIAVRAGSPRVTLLRTPDGGIQPQAVVDTSGVIHLIYFKGDSGKGDVFYVRREPGKDGFSTPMRVNSQPGSAIAAGTIRGAQIALGKAGRVHVAWNGSGRAIPKGPGGGAPMLYARLNDAGTAFEPQRNLMLLTRDLDGGGSVAADGAGNVYVAWHAHEGSSDGEQGRRLWVARSRDEGKSFAREAPAYATATGACACCGTRAFADSRGTVYVLYRSASTNVDRDMYLLVSQDRGESFRGERLHPWKIAGCPMSSESFAESEGIVVAAWETQGQVYYTRIDPRTGKRSRPIAAPGAAKDRKHPSVAANDLGEVILVWTEGTGWQKGGSLAWQVFDAAGQPSSERGRVAGGIPVWGLATVAPRPDGGFTILY